MSDQLAARSPIDDDDLRGIERVVYDEIMRCWQDDLLYGGDADRIDPDGWIRSTFPTAAARIAARLMPLLDAARAVVDQLADPSRPITVDDGLRRALADLEESVWSMEPADE